jgi:hypothetical protein
LPVDVSVLPDVLLPGTCQSVVRLKPLEPEADDVGPLPWNGIPIRGTARLQPSQRVRVSWR